MKRDVILSRLLDKYEKSKHLLSPGVSKRRVMLRVRVRERKKENELPEYDYQDATVRDEFNQAAKDLEREGLISVEWLEGRPVLSKVFLNLGAVDQCYRSVGREHPKERAEAVAKAIENALACVETPWIAAWRDDVCVRAKSTYAVPNFCKQDASCLSRLLTALAQFDSLRGEPITMRAFSSKCYHDSKYFEREIRDIFLNIAEKYDPELRDLVLHITEKYGPKLTAVYEHEKLGVRDKLAFLGIYARPELYELSGRCTLTTAAGTIDIGAAYPYGIALPSTAVDAVTQINLSGIGKVVFLENKTNYDEYLLSELKPDTLAIYHGGFLSPQKRKLFSKIGSAIPRDTQCFFWADIDLGGFQMFSHLQKLIPNLSPMRMTGNDVITHCKDGLKRSEDYLDRLKQAYFDHTYPLFDNAIREILHYGVTIEQEAFLALRGQTEGVDNSRQIVAKAYW